MQQAQAGGRVIDGGGDHVAKGFQALAQRRGEEGQHLFARGGVDGADCEVAFQAE